MFCELVKIINKKVERCTSVVLDVTLLLIQI
jgi:hypothetical protein